MLALAIATGCRVGPNYRRPAVNIPATYRADPLAGSSRSFGDLKWWDVFNDPRLQELLRAGLANNYDIRIAATRIEQAEANLRIVRSQLFPQVGASASYARNQTSGASSIIPGVSGFTRGVTSATAGVSWVLDFWGQYRRAAEGARAQLLASRDAEEAVRVTLVSQLASSYFQLLELDLELEATNRALKTRVASLDLTRIREAGGVASMLEVRQAESLVTTARATVPQILQQTAQVEDAISALIGENPRDIDRGVPLAQQIMPTVPSGLPSALLERRPDIRGAEQTLVAANAQIGVARAAYFPQIALTASGGTQSASLGKLFTPGSRIWSFGPDLSVPIFTAGRIAGQVQLTEAQRNEAVLRYQQTIQEAFREVSDALIAYQRTTEFRREQEVLTETYRQAASLSQIRYRGGITTYLEVLDSERNVYGAELTLARARLQELNAVVELYAALGGGWQQ